MTTCTVLRPNGQVEARGLTIEDAGITVLTYDGRLYEIIADEDGPGFRLWVSPHSVNAYSGCGGMYRTDFYSDDPDRAKAEAEILADVAFHADLRNMQVLEDCEYDQILAEAEGE